jgi:hypothetical protein
MTEIIVAFRDFANAPDIFPSPIEWHCNLSEVSSDSNHVSCMLRVQYMLRDMYADVCCLRGRYSSDIV